LVFTNSGSLSPDGTRFVYGGEGDRIYVLDLQSKLSRPLTGGFYDNFPFWSPDGTRIAFRRRTDQGQNIYVMDADGQNVRALTESTENPILIGWAPNSHQVIFSVWKQGQSHIQILNVDRGEAEPLITTDRDILFGISISSDEQWMAYVDSVPGEMAGGIYVARLDGTEKRLLVQLHFLSVSQLLWSPDGKWLAFRVSDNSPTISKSTEGLINVENCQVVPLLNLNGGIRGWVK
jgi:Tol biopolymer transport system component